MVKRVPCKSVARRSEGRQEGMRLISRVVVVRLIYQEQVFLGVRLDSQSRPRPDIKRQRESLSRNIDFSPDIPPTHVIPADSAARLTTAAVAREVVNGRRFRPINAKSRSFSVTSVQYRKHMYE